MAEDPVKTFHNLPEDFVTFQAAMDDIACESINWVRRSSTMTKL